jgi:hypothetical protein
MNPNSTVLQQLHGIHVPPDAGYWPPAPGWWVLTGLVLLCLIVLLRWLYRRVKRGRRCRRILASLTELGQQSTANKGSNILVAQVSILLRRVALMTHARQQVAGLTGQHWLQFLDDTGGQGEFCNGIGRVLADGPYAPDTQVNVEELLALAARWINKNLGVLK